MNNRKNVSKEKMLRTVFSIILGAVLLLFDQLTKKLAVMHLKDKPAFVLIEGVLEFDYLENRGVAFGMFQNQRWPILLVGMLLMGALIWIICRLPEGKKYSVLQFILVCIVAGGIGNMIDRVMLGYVVDFISFVLINYPVFNVADCYVVCATIGLFIMLLFFMKDEDFEFLSLKKKKEAAPEKTAEEE